MVGGKALGFILGILIIVADQATKHLSVLYLMNKKPIVLINDLIELHFVKNYGAAFGILQNQRLFFISVTTLVLVVMSIYMIKNQKKLTLVANIAMGFLLGGALGNLIDRVRLGYVVDFIKVDLGRLYDFPVFNIADIFIVIGTGLLIFVILFDKYDKAQVI
ncbi:signal peptidase II [Gudongella sp. DL1XJH-153]|uniref:signal peptidase II n=1 Tax=Gudongella sp. DL1XJH-153 TaxID=3409804 RepID=UPI003BB5DDF6